MPFLSIGKGELCYTVVRYLREESEGLWGKATFQLRIVELTYKRNLHHLNEE